MLIQCRSDHMADRAILVAGKLYDLDSDGVTRVPEDVAQRLLEAEDTPWQPAPDGYRWTQPPRPDVRPGTVPETQRAIVAAELDLFDGGDLWLQGPKGMENRAVIISGRAYGCNADGVARVLSEDAERLKAMDWTDAPDGYKPPVEAAKPGRPKEPGVNLRTSITALFGKAIAVATDLVVDVDRDGFARGVPKSIAAKLLEIGGWDSDEPGQKPEATEPEPKAPQRRPKRSK